MNPSQYQNIKKVLLTLNEMPVVLIGPPLVGKHFDFDILNIKDINFYSLEKDILLFSIYNPNYPRNSHYEINKICFPIKYKNFIYSKCSSLTLDEFYYMHRNLQFL